MTANFFFKIIITTKIIRQHWARHTYTCSVEDRREREIERDNCLTHASSQCIILHRGIGYRIHSMYKYAMKLLWWYAHQFRIGYCISISTFEDVYELNTHQRQRQRTYKRRRKCVIINSSCISNIFLFLSKYYGL